MQIPFHFAVFTVKSPSVIPQRSVSQENAFKKSKNLSPFLDMHDFLSKHTYSQL